MNVKILFLKYNLWSTQYEGLMRLQEELKRRSKILKPIFIK